MAAERFNLRARFVSRHRRERTREHKSFAGQRQSGGFLRRNSFALRFDSKRLHSLQGFAPDGRSKKRERAFRRNGSDFSDNLFFVFAF